MMELAAICQDMSPAFLRFCVIIHELAERLVTLKFVWCIFAAPISCWWSVVLALGAK